MLLGAFAVQAAESDVVFPIAELGDCASKVECRAYCDKTENIEACTTYGETHKLISSQAAERAKKLLRALREGGPGGCKDEKSCRAYCNDSSHVEECAAFAERHQLISADDAERLKKLKDIAILRKTEKTPGDCYSISNCQTYCSDPAHASECIAFAEKIGAIQSDEADRAKKVIPLLRKGETPGKCTSQAECRAYCEDTSHAKECAEFAVKIGILDSEEADQFQRTAGKGPGGCDSRESCKAYCSDTAHQQECMAFAKEHGIIRTTPSSVEPMERPSDLPSRESPISSGAPVVRRQLPPIVLKCLQLAVGQQLADRIDRGEQPDQKTEAILRTCYERMRPGMSKPPIPSELPPRPSSVPSWPPIPTEFERGGATNLPEPQAVRPSWKQHSYFASFLKLLLDF